MKRFLIIASLFFFLLQATYGQSKVAVLDASLGVGVHPNAAAIVADTINEQFVKSGDYIAIDRAYISNIQAEKQFQLSGEVADQDIKELGATFGADYLCIANVSLLGSTYTVSARLIEVQSAQVVAQESHRLQGEIDVLFTIAEVVGSKFVGSDLASQPVTQPEKQPATQPVEEAEAAPTPSAPAPKPKPRATKWEP
jgi:TolB-like protein